MKIHTWKWSIQTCRNIKNVTICAFVIIDEKFIHKINLEYHIANLLLRIAILQYLRCYLLVVYWCIKCNVQVPKRGLRVGGYYVACDMAWSYSDNCWCMCRGKLFELQIITWQNKMLFMQTESCGHLFSDFRMEDL